ncbi:hypothetical protein [Litoribacillus peritrichatus]|uniref:ATP-binding protein n=1 Tax=Litoribacillus peritrichatus TaxID=718191 RepID=A0ABP7MKP7_9GAMM
MKKITRDQRIRDVKRVLKQRILGSTTKRKRHTDNNLNGELGFNWLKINDWIKNERTHGLVISDVFNGKKLKRNRIVVHLPERMNFSNEYDSTVQCLTAIRKLTSLYENVKTDLPKKALKLASVNFDKLASISTSAALVLTAEVSKWNISIRKKLKPQVENWNKDIFIQFEQLGFFDLFENKPSRKNTETSASPDVDFVRYVKGQCGNSDEAKAKKKELKAEIIKLVGDNVAKWTILHSGLTEAVTNVTHHAYPDEELCEEKSWYLTGSYNKQSKEMKVAFFDQGIGIPNSLPASQIWEKVLSYFSKLQLPIAEQAKHAKLLEAAVSIDRTSTDKNDRGKGLQDLLEFIRERGEGYLSIFSYHGLYKCWIENGKEYSKAEGMKRPLNGTLIIWNVKLN